MHSLSSYDELPYDRLPLTETEPDFLAALARLHGFDSADAAHARVLELGCAQGGNLIPMAARYPESEFIGVDLSRVQVEEGRAFVALAELANIRLLHGDVAALPHGLGEFDFIIAHGVYSWVPADVREALLAACRQLLKPQGIAYVSFNVEAGWQVYGQIREALLKQDNASLSPMERVRCAKRVLAEMQMDDERLIKEIDYLKSASVAYLFHEYLSAINQPLSFETFMREADRHGLRYLGEAGPRRARVVLENGSDLSALARYERWLTAEAKLDVALQTRFRRALLVREDASVPSPLAVTPLVDLAFSAQLTSDEELDFADFTTQHFQSASGERYPIAHPLLKAFLMVLASAHPDQLAYATAVSRALPLAREYGYRGEADEDFLDALLDTIQLHAVKLHTHARAFGGGIEHHRPSRLARLQAQNPQWPVTTRSHQALDLDEWGRWLLVQTGEGLGEAELTGKLAARLESAGIKFEIAQAQKLVHDYLTLFQQHGLLV